MKRKLLIVMAGIAFLMLFLAQATAQEQYSVNPFELTIIETSDIHGAFFPYDFKTDQVKNSSLSQAATLIKAEREKNPNVLLLDGGDNLQGQPIVYYYNFMKTDSMNIFSEMMNYLDYDAVAVGNHDVETGHAVYDKVRKELNMPMLSANLVNKTDGAPYFQPYSIIMKGGVKIAVLGLTTPGFRKNFPEILYSGIKIVDMVETAKKWIPIIMEKEKPDLLIGLFHSGVDYKYAKGEDVDTPLNENAAQVVAQKVPGFDLVLVAHDHQGWEGLGLNKAQVVGPNNQVIPIFGPVDECKKIPVINVTMKWNAANKAWEKKIEGKLVATSASVPADSAMVKAFDEEFQLVKAWVSKPVGKMNGVMMASDSMFGDSSFVDMVHSLQLAITEDPENGLKKASISFCAPLDANAIVPSSKDGTIYIRDMFSLYRYENWMYTMTLYGRQIKGFLEASYDGWLNTMKGPDDHLIAFLMKDGKLDLDARTSMPRTKVATYNYDSAAGIVYTVDVSKPAGSRITIESLANGDPFVLDKIYVVAINSYRAMGGGGLLEKGAGISAADLLSMKYVTSATTRDLRYYLTEWFENQNMKVITPQALNTWKIIPEAWATAGKALDYPLMYPAKK